MIAAGLELFGTVGYANTSIKKICTQAGLTERYFYESFQCKEDLLSSVYHALTTEMIAQTQKVIDSTGHSNMEIGYKALKLYFQSLQDDPRKARVLFFEILGVSPRIDQAYQQGIHDLSCNAMTILQMAYPALDAYQLEKTILPAALAGAIIQVASQWILADFEPALEEILAQVMHLVNLVDGMITKMSDSGR